MDPNQVIIVLGRNKIEALRRPRTTSNIKLVAIAATTVSALHAPLALPGFFLPVVAVFPV
jgi:hypothetical protein